MVARRRTKSHSVAIIVVGTAVSAVLGVVVGLVVLRFLDRPAGNALDWLIGL